MAIIPGVILFGEVDDMLQTRGVEQASYSSCCSLLQLGFGYANDSVASTPWGFERTMGNFHDLYLLHPCTNTTRH